MVKSISWILLFFVLCCGCNWIKKKSFFDPAGIEAYSDKKILVLHSYHPEGAGPDGKNKGLTPVLESSGVEYTFHYMDTQRNQEEAYILNAAASAYAKIEAYNPDVVIAFDDNAFKHVIMPYYKDAELPVVFAGIDWDISVYDAPYTNTAGMISVALVVPLLGYLKEYAGGGRIAWLGNDTYTSRKEVQAYREILGNDMTSYYVSNFAEWKSRFVALQSSADILLHSGMLTGLSDWDAREARAFALANIKIPVGTVNQQTMGCSVFGLVKIPWEQGAWAATTALAILAGQSPAEIPLARNKEGEIILNLDLAEKLDLAFSYQILKTARIYEGE